MTPNERIEWTRCWREDADREKIRVLLIGDSVVEGIKHEVYNALLVGHPEYKTDSYHYNADGKALLGRAVAQKITEALASSERERSIL